jgi:hypothetical protein
VDEQTITASLLRKLMSGISEEYWCAGWLSGLEYTLWDAVTGKGKDICSLEEIEQLKYLSGKCGGWIIWDEQAKDEKFVPMEEWLRPYEAKRHKRSAKKDE